MQDSIVLATAENTLRPIAVTFPTACKLSGVGPTTLWKLAKENRIEVVHVGRRALILYKSLERLLAPNGKASMPRRRGRPRKTPVAS